MSSPLAFPDSDDVPMQDGEGSQQTPTRPAARKPLFNSPSVAGTPIPGMVARRALAGVTPRKNTPVRGNATGLAGSSSPLIFPSSSPKKGGLATQPNFDDSDAPMSDARRGTPLFHPATPVGTTPRRSHRGDVHPSALTSPLLRRAAGQPGLAFPPSDGVNPLASGPAHSIITPSEGPDVRRVLWGTSVNVQDSLVSFRDFLSDFKVKYRRMFDSLPRLPPAHPDDHKTLYQGYLGKMRTTQQTTLNLDMTNLMAFPGTKKEFYPALVKYPQEIIPIMDIVLKEAILTMAENDGADEEELRWLEDATFRVRPFGGKIEVNMRELNPGDTDRLVAIKGLVIRATPVIPDMKVGFFRCLTCSHTVQVEIDRGRIAEPDRCPRDVCGSVGTMSLIHNRSEFADRQIIRLQETPDAVPDGQTPHTVSLGVYDELVDVSKPGDRLTITGIFRSIPVRVNPHQRTIKALFKTYIDVVHIKRGDGKRMGFDTSTRQASALAPTYLGVGGEADDDEENAHPGMDADDVNMTRQAALEAELTELSQRPDIYELLSRSLAPSVWEMDDVKKGILLQLFGGTNKSIAKGGGGGGPRYRGDINVLMVGDPGTSKSQILMDFLQEQQTVSIAKAGIITTLNARTSILAAANPVGSKYNINWPITRNIDLPPTLISRFDLLYLVLDKIDETLDRRLAEHLVKLYVEDAPETGGQDILDIEKLTAYITHGRSRIHPRLSDEASSELVASYVDMRSMGEDPRTKERRITATTRQLESLIRLSEAHARMRFSHVVGREDVQEANRLMREAIRMSATDPNTGLIDLDLINTGAGMQERRLKGDLKRELVKMLNGISGGKGVRWTEAMKQLQEQSSVTVEAAEFTEAVKALENDGLIKVVGERDKRVIRLITSD
ncbi:hypothetical protein FRB96_004268 [Tulasnella sp. 330]|nr:hypothetical protein FRB96_004268 [Tulasnella sp. 330]